MGKIDNFEIILDKPNPYYFGGEILSGRVTLKCKERFKINNIHIDIIGSSKVFWYLFG